MRADASELRPVHEVEAELMAPGAPFETETVRVWDREIRAWKVAPPTVAHLVATMADRGSHAYTVYEDERTTYAEAAARIAALGHVLQGELGVSKGDRVAIAMRNYPEWPLIFLATMGIGAIAVPVNAWWKGEELSYALSDSGSSVIFADAERAGLLDSVAAAELPVLRQRIVVRGGGRAPAGWSAFEDLLAQRAPEPGLKLPEGSVEPDDEATIFYTSGTTGRPKGALGTHRNLLTNLVSAAFGRVRARMRLGESLEAIVSAPVPPPVQLVSVPFFHVTGSHSVLTGTTAAGGTLVLMYRWNPERALELIERERVTSFGGVPSMVWQVLESPDFGKRDTSSVTGIGYGGAPASPELVRRIEQAFPEVAPSNGYGMTETSAISTLNVGVDYLLRPGSIGRPVGAVDVKIVDESGQTLGVGELGELCIRGPNVVKGYWKMPEATAETFRDGGWCHSGDIARVDEEGFVEIVDRAKDMVIRGGENIYCVEVEDALYSHPDVMDAAVVGLPHPVLGEEPAAVVQLTAAAQVGEQELQKHVGERLARFKVPVSVELRREPLPRNANGKILKRQLRDEYVARRSQPGAQPAS